MKGLQRSIGRGAVNTQSIIKTVIPFNETLSITGVADAKDVAGVALGAMPKTQLLILGAVLNITVDATGEDSVIADWTGDLSVGSTIDDDLDLNDNGGLIRIIEVTAASGLKTSGPLVYQSVGTYAGAFIDNSSGTLNYSLNLALDDNMITDGETANFVCSGTLVAAFVPMGVF